MKNVFKLGLITFFGISAVAFCLIVFKSNASAAISGLTCFANRFDAETSQNIGSPTISIARVGRGYSDAGYTYRTYALALFPTLPSNATPNPYVGIMADCKGMVDVPTENGMRPVDAYLPSMGGLLSNPKDIICDGVNGTSGSVATSPNVTPPVYGSDGCGVMQYAAVPDDGMAVYINNTMTMCLNMTGRVPANHNPGDGVWRWCGYNLTDHVSPTDPARNPFGWRNGAGFAFSPNSCAADTYLKRSISENIYDRFLCNVSSNTDWTKENQTLPPVGVAGNTYFRLINGGPFNYRRSEFLNPTFKLRMAVFNSVPAGYTSKFFITFKYPKPINIQGRTFVLNQSAPSIPSGPGDNISGVKIDTCNGTTVTSGGDGFFSYSTGYGMPFCLNPVNAGRDGYFGPYIRPWGTESYDKSYLGKCGPFGVDPRNPQPNYCTGISSYQWQVAGLEASREPNSHDPHENLEDRYRNDGYDFVYIVAPAPKCSLTTASKLELGDSISILAQANGAANISFKTQFNDGGLGLKNTVPASVKMGSDGNWTLASPITGTASTPGKYTVTLTFLAADGTSNSCSATITVGNQPYLKVYGNDVSVGDRFAGATGQSCDVGSSRSTILTLGNNDQGVYTGAGSQLAAFALGQIDQYFSGGMQQGSAQASAPPIGLTFGNYKPGANPSTLGFGGRSGVGHCATDYYSILTANQPVPTAFTSTLNTASIGALTYVKAPTNTPLNLVSSSDFTGKKALVVDGDVYIGSNINYGTYSSAADLPSFYLVVKGKIFVGKGVTNLSGVYVAQPDSGDDGTIYTCSEPNGFVAAANLYNDCRTKLTINGAFIAKSVKFMRTNGTKKDSQVNETWESPSIAEVFKSSPEMYLSAPPALTNVGGSNTTYDSITSLPPIL